MPYAICKCGNYIETEEKHDYTVLPCPLCKAKQALKKEYMKLDKVSLADLLIKRMTDNKILKEAQRQEKG